MPFNTLLKTNVPALGIPYFTPAQVPAAGTALQPQPNGNPIPKLFQPIKIRGKEFQNRIWVSPLCQYSSVDGKITPWHHAHLGGILTRGPGLTFVEANGVLPTGRITPNDTGIWSDEHVTLYKPLVEFAHSQSQKIGIQLFHAGRKSSTVAPWLQNDDFGLGVLATEDLGGWPHDVVAPSSIPYKSYLNPPRELTVAEIKDIVQGFKDAARRAVEAGFDVVEIHGAHGFLLHQFASPVSNKRTDKYGGSFENRIRIILEVVDAVRGVLPDDIPLFYRVSATEWLEDVLPDEPSWRSEDTVKLAGILAEHGVDLLDVSTGGNHEKAQIKWTPLFQVPFAEAVKKELGDKILVSAVGGITNGRDAQGILEKGQADVVFVGRYFQRNPGAVWAFADDIGVDILQPHQIEWPYAGRGNSMARRLKN